MSELGELCAAASRLRVAQRWGLLATVVRVEGSAYRRPGARMLVADDTWLAGSISAGCLERDVLARGAFRTRMGPAVVRYDATESASGCGGVVDVLVERLDPTARFDPLRFAASCLAADPPGALVTMVSGPDLGRRVAVRAGDVAHREVDQPGLIGLALSAIAERRRASVATIDGATALVEVFTVAPRVFVVGAQHDAHALLSVARAAGLAVNVVGTSVSPSLRERFGDVLVVAEPDVLARWVVAHASAAAVVIMSHDEARDRACLAATLATQACYVGVLGPRERTARMLDAIGAPEDARARVRGPAGLDLGAEGPSEIALAIVAEIVACFAKASGRSLTSRTSPTS